MKFLRRSKLMMLPWLQLFLCLFVYLLLSSLFVIVSANAWNLLSEYCISLCSNSSNRSCDDVVIGDESGVEVAIGVNGINCGDVCITEVLDDVSSM